MVKQFAIVAVQYAERRLAQPQRFFEHRIENGREIAGRGIDDLQDLGGCGLAGERLVEPLTQLRIGTPIQRSPLPAPRSSSAPSHPALVI